MRRRLVPLLLALGAAALLAPAAWLHATGDGHIHDEAHAPGADVAIVFGAQLRADGKRPKPFLTGRLDTAVALYQAGKAKALLVSGDANGDSGDEIAAMTRYLRDRGVPERRIVADPHGLDTYDTCRRAREVYGVRRALLVSQDLHLPRAVTLCRHFGIDADGVAARCPDCRSTTKAKNRLRELPAAIKAAWDVFRDRPPAVTSTPDPGALPDAVTG